MTLKDIEDGGMELDEPEFVEELPDEVLSEEIVRHLATNGKTLCGLNTTGLNTIHPSKAKKTDCADCRSAWREKKSAKAAAPVAAPAIPVIAPVIAPLRTGRWKPTLAEIRQVKKLRHGGMGLSKIDEAMGWPDSHGNRPWRILKGLATPSDAE